MTSLEKHSTHQVHNLKELITTMQLSPKDQPVLLIGPDKKDKIEWLTALIVHVFNSEEDPCILITTPDNRFADTLAVGLLRFVQSDSVIRIVSTKAIMRRKHERSFVEFNTLQEVSKHCSQLGSLFGRRIVVCTTSMSIKEPVAGKHWQFTHTVIVDCAESRQTMDLISKIRVSNSISKLCGQLWLTSEFWPPMNEASMALIDVPKFMCTFRKDFGAEDVLPKPVVGSKRSAPSEQSDVNYSKRRELNSNATLFAYNPIFLNSYNVKDMYTDEFQLNYAQELENPYFDLASLPYSTEPAGDMQFYNQIEPWTYEPYTNPMPLEQFQQDDHKSEPSCMSPEDFEELKCMLITSSKMHAQEDQTILRNINNFECHLPCEPFRPPDSEQYSDIDFNRLLPSHSFYEAHDEHNLQLYSDYDRPMIHNYTDFDQYPTYYDETTNQTKPNLDHQQTSPHTFICGPLPEFPPSPIIDKLTKLKFEFSDQMSTEEVYTLQKIRDFRGFARPVDYVPMMRIIIGVEDCFVQNDRTRHDRPNRQAVVMEGAPTNPYFCSITSDSVPAFVMAGDKVLLSIESSDGEKSEVVLGEVRAVCESTLDLELSHPMKPDAKYTMHFALNRLNFRLEQFAMQNIQDLNLTTYLFPQSHTVCPGNSRNFKFYNQRLQTERNQRKAVQDIVAGEFYPCPYILSGCAGSGKTDIIVESIIQLHNVSPNNRVLVCSPSNGVLDEITVRLASWSVEVRSSCLRLFASSTENNVEKGSTLYKVSNFSQGGKNSYIYVADLIRRSRIVLSTLAVSGRIALTNLEKTFFTHIFIDECHASGEPMTLVPIASICSSMGRINARVILVGDPQQMGPVVKSPWAKRLNYGRSLMARLLQLSIYKQNPMLSSTLIANYRSHSKIVQVAGSLFYGHRMTPNACLQKTTTMFPDISFPIKFDNVNGKPSKGTSCDSWYNMAEVHHVISLVVYLVQVNRVRLDDIGIISPYRRQIMKIANQLGAWRHRIKVGSVEQFQGVERHIIIVSTVRTKNLGFVTDPGRINVILTRAISILVVVGNASSLEKQSCEWAKVIEICRENGTLCQV